MTFSTISLKFGIAGFLLAIGIGFLFFGFFWVFVPGVVLSALATSAVATCLGRQLEVHSVNFGLSVYLVFGVGIALLTLLSGILALGVTNVVMATVDDAFSLNLGLGPWISLAHAVDDYVVKPVLGVVIFGGPIAGIFGLAYGVTVYAKRRGARAA